MNALVRRSGAAVAAAVLTLGLAACGSSSTNNNAAMTDSPSANAASGPGAQTFGPACSAIPKTGAGSFSGMDADPVATAASNNPLLSTLVTAVKKAGLVSTLNSASGLTVFAPDNAAFAKIPAATLAKVLANKMLLTEILTHHVVAGQLDPNQVIGMHTTLNKDSVTVSGSTGSGMKVDGANVLCGNIPTSNATVYVIDSVLMPATK